VIETGSFNSRF